METYGRLFNGGIVKFSINEHVHAQHLLMDGGRNCDCVERGIEARNGKFAAIAFTIGNSDIKSMHNIELNPDDVIEMANDLAYFA